MKKPMTHTLPQDRSPASRLRSTAAYQRFRACILSERPLCEDPHGHHAADKRLVPACEVHHIIPLAFAPSILCAPDNVMALCQACHDVFTEAERNKKTH